MRRSTIAVSCAALAACASTSLVTTPSPQAAVCQADAKALVLWSTEWRPDQKDVPDRERAAESGISKFFGLNRCFASVNLQRGSTLSEEEIRTALKQAPAGFNRAVTIRVRELGPVVRLLSSAALVDGGTEVKLEISEYDGSSSSLLRKFTVHWQNGGPGVVKGIGSLGEDMMSALALSLQPPTGAN